MTTVKNALCITFLNIFNISKLVHHTLLCFLEPGASDDPCSGTFRGPSAASEPEIQAVSQVITEESAHIVALVTIHTAGQYWLLPWGIGDEEENCLYPDDYDDLVNILQFTFT